MKVAAFIANRIAFNRQKSFSRFIIRLSIVATLISVAVMIVTLSFVNGFQETVSQKVFSFWGHIRIQFKQPMKAAIAEEIPIDKDDSVAAAVLRDPRVESVHPFATKYALLKTREEIEGVLLKGLNAEYDSAHMTQFIREGRWIRFNDSTYSREILLSAYTANQLNISVNDPLLIYFIRPDGSLRPDKLKVVGIFKTGIEEYDKTFAIGDIRLIQRLNGWSPNEIGGYEVFLNDYGDIAAVSDDLYALNSFPVTWDTKSVREIYPNIFDWLNMQNLTRNLLIVFMVIVAVINLITCLIILVLERIRMIGVLKSLGASDWVIRKIFLRHGAFITLTGIIAGTLFALGLLRIQKSTGFIRLQEEAYYMSTAAVKTVWWQVLLVCAGTLLICFLVLTIPSLIVKKVQPVKAIRFT